MNKSNNVGLTISSSGTTMSKVAQFQMSESGSFSLSVVAQFLVDESNASTKLAFFSIAPSNLILSKHVYEKLEVWNLAAFKLAPCKVTPVSLAAM